MPQVIHPAPLALALDALEGAFAQLRQLVEARASRDEIQDATARARARAAELERRAPGVHLLEAASGGNDPDIARHLRFAARYSCQGNDYPDDDARDLVGRDLFKLRRHLSSAEFEHPHADELRRALAGGEGATVDFKETIPKNTTRLADVLASMGSSGGRVFLGIDKTSQVVGVPEVAVAQDTAQALDEFELRLIGIAQKVDPPIQLAVAWMAIGNKAVAEARVLPSGEPIHYSERVPYLRDGTSSRPARPEEVRRAILEHARRLPLLRLEPGAPLAIRDTDGRDAQGFAVVRVTNLGHPLFKVRAEARFLTADGAPVFDRSMPVRWSSAPEPITLTWTPHGLGAVTDPTKVPLSYTITLAPGDTEDAAVAIKFADEERAWGWTGESYVHSWRHPDWRLSHACTQVEVAVWADGREQRARFGIDVQAFPRDFILTPLAT